MPFGVVEDQGHFGVDGVPGGEGLVQFQLAHHVPEGGGGEVVEGVDGVDRAVGEKHGVEHAEVHDGVDLHGDVVLRDHGLGRRVEDLFLEGDFLRDSLEEGDLEVHPGFPGVLVFAEEFNDVCLALGNHPQVGGDEPHDERRDDDDRNILHIGFSFPHGTGCASDPTFRFACGDSISQIGWLYKVLRPFLTGI